MSIAISVILTLITFLFLFYFWVLYFWNKSHDIFLNNGMLLFEIDLQTKRLFLFNQKINKYINTWIFKGIKSNEWFALKKFLNNFEQTVGAKKIRNAFSDVAKGHDRKSFSFQIKKETKLININFEIYPMSDSSNKIMNVGWNIVGINSTLTNVTKQMSKIKVIELPFAYKGFVAFNLKGQDIFKKGIEFYDFISKVVLKKRLNYLIHNSFFIVLFYHHNEKSLSKLMNRFQHKILTTGLKKGLVFLFKGSAVAKAQNLNSYKKLNAVFRILDYNISLSLCYNEPFVSIWSKNFSQSGYYDFKKAASDFKNKLKMENVATKLIPIKNIKNNRTIVKYSHPIINSINSKLFWKILLNKYYKSQIINTHALQISHSSKDSPKKLVDINIDWFLENYERMTFKKAIYLIDFSTMSYKKFSKIEMILQKMKANGFMFGIRIFWMNDYVVTILKKNHFQYIVVDQELINNIYDFYFSKLLVIKYIFERHGVKVILENPEPKLSLSRIENIGIKFYYKLT